MTRVGGIDPERIGWAATVLALSACTFDSTGLGRAMSGPGPGPDGDSASSGDGDGEGPPDSGGDNDDDGDQDTGPGNGGTTGGVAETTGAAGGTTEGDGGDGTTGHDSDGEDPGAETGGPTGGSDGDGTVCDGAVEIVVLVADATVEPPMERTGSTMGEGEVAVSVVPEEGTVTFEVDIPCDDVWNLWGRVNDFSPGIGPNDPDSYWISVDGGPEYEWFYGCDTEFSPQWSWQPMESNMAGVPCEKAIAVTPVLDAGVHLVRLRNREGLGSGEVFAAVARILATNDPDLVPSDQ